MKNRGTKVAAEQTDDNDDDETNKLKNKSVAFLLFFHACTIILQKQLNH